MAEGTLILGHRGASNLAPENTAASFRAALAHGADGIETDVRLSVDGVPFLLHDPTLDRTTDAAARGLPAHTRAETLPWQVLSQLDAGSWFSPQYAGEHLVALADLPEVVGTGLIDLEVKTPTDHSTDHVVEALTREFAGPQWRDPISQGRVILTSFDPLILERAIEQIAVPVGLLTEGAPSPGDLATAREAGIRAVLPGHAAITPEFSEACQRAGVELWTWTVNDPARFRDLEALGVRAICTDDPAAMAR